MKKLILLALLAALSLTIVACNETNDPASDTEADTTAETTAAATEDETTGETEPVTEEQTVPANETESETKPETDTEPETDTQPETKPATPTWKSGDNVALNQYTYASGSAWDGDMWGIAMVTDGSIMETEFDEGGTNGWMSNAVASVNEQTWIAIDLSQEIPINKIVLYPRQSGERFPKGFIVEVSLDGSTWTKVIEETNDPYTLEGRVFEFDTVNAAYVRLTTTEMHADSYVESFGGYIAQLSEIEVYAA